jgi:hypothetical protein
MNKLNSILPNWSYKGILWLNRMILALVAIVLAILLYQYVLVDFIDFNPGGIFTYFLIWVISAYFLLPMLHRWLSRVYLPQYFIGRARTSDGLLSDPINLAFIGSANDLRKVMAKAGWAEADKLSIKTGIKFIYSLIANKSYPEAPVDSLYLFNKKPALVFQKQINGSPREKHHIRLWKTPSKWYLPGGHKANWLGAAHHDEKFSFKAYILQFSHKIEADIDVERDYIIKMLKSLNLVSKIKIVKHYTSGYHDINGGGDAIYTDGSLPFVYLKKQ